MIQKRINKNYIRFTQSKKFAFDSKVALVDCFVAFVSLCYTRAPRNDEVGRFAFDSFGLLRAKALVMTEMGRESDSPCNDDNSVRI